MAKTDAVNQVPVTNSCPICDATALRDEKLLDAIQTARYTLTASDGIKDPKVRDARIRAALDEALRLMGNRSW